MKIGFDAKRLFNNFTGLGNYSRAVVKNLQLNYPEHDYFLYTPRVNNNEETTPFLNNSDFHLRTPSKGSIKPLWRSKGIATDLKNDQIDIFHGLSHEIPFGLNKIGVKSVVSMHDVIFKIYPDQYQWLDRTIYDYKFKWACEHADRIVAISESTKHDMISYYGADASKIDVVYQPCSDLFYERYAEAQKQEVLKKYNLPTEFLLYVGSVIPRKNLMNIVKAIEEMDPKDRIPLVVIGGGGAYKEEVKSYVSQSDVLNPLVHWPSFIPNEDLAILYQQARAFIYPSVYEGFGIPILEGLASQVPVITCDRSSLGEVGGDAVLYVDPDSPTSMASAIQTAFYDEAKRNDLIDKGIQQAAKFDKHKLSEDMMNVYLKVKSSL